MNKKAIYKPTKQNTVILSSEDGFCEILLDGDFKRVPEHDLELVEIQYTLSSLDELKENIFLNCIKNPLSDILYSYNTNKLTPEPHQYKPLIKFLDSENNRILIADEVGLGKTIEAGMIYKEIDQREELKISLIVVPSSLTYKWRHEFRIRFDEDFSIYKTNQFLTFIDDVENYSSSKLIHEKIIISYHTLRDERVMEKLEGSFFEIDFLIMDEAHTMRNSDTSTHRSAEIITSLSEHIVFLTATPVQNSLYDLFNILSLLENDYFKDYEYFEKMLEPNATIHKLIALIRNGYSLTDIKQFIKDYQNDNFPTRLKEIFSDILKLEDMQDDSKIYFIDKLIQSDQLSFIINRSKKKDIGLSIPRNAASNIVEITNEEKNYYNAVIEFVKFLNPDTPQGFITIMPERMASSSMIASLESFKEMKNSGKLFIKDIDDLEDYYEDIDIQEEARSYLDDIISKGELIGEDDSKFLKFEEILKNLKKEKIKQMIVFSFFKKTLNYLEDKLEHLGYKVGKIHGDFSVEERYATIKKFENKDFDILLSSEVGSEGLDMQFCNVIINYDLPWNPMRVEQRIGRIDRIGQKSDKLHIFNLCIVGSIEDRILNRLYSKLDIFENYIGELEPILGELEKELNITKLMSLSQEEIDKELSLKELALHRKKTEITEQSAKFEEMLNEDLNYMVKEKAILNPLKITLLQEQSKKIFLEYLQNNEISFLSLKNQQIKISSNSLKRLFNLLKAGMSDKKSLKYKEEKPVLQSIHKLENLKVSFETNNNDNFETLYMHLSNPIISIITKNKTYKEIYTIASHESLNDGFAVIYRVDFQQLKPKSYIKTIILDKDFSFIEEIDYFEFITKCSTCKDKMSTKPKEIKSKFNAHIANSIETQKSIEEESQNRLIKLKIHSIDNYFEKQISKARRLKKQVEDGKIITMKIGEIDNLEIKRDKKIKELESKKKITSSFKILGIMEIV